MHMNIKFFSFMTIKASNSSFVKRYFNQRTGVRVSEWVGLSIPAGSGVGGRRWWSVISSKRKRYQLDVFDSFYGN